MTEFQQKYIIFIFLYQGSDLCKCGLKLSEHDKSLTVEKSGDWVDDNEHTKAEPTNAFGEVKFVNTTGKTAKV